MLTSFIFARFSGMRGCFFKNKSIIIIIIIIVILIG